MSTRLTEGMAQVRCYPRPRTPGPLMSPAPYTSSALERLRQPMSAFRVRTHGRGDAGLAPTRTV